MISRARRGLPVCPAGLAAPRQHRHRKEQRGRPSTPTITRTQQEEVARRWSWWKGQRGKRSAPSPPRSRRRAHPATAEASSLAEPAAGATSHRDSNNNKNRKGPFPCCTRATPRVCSGAWTPTPPAPTWRPGTIARRSGGGAADNDERIAWSRSVLRLLPRRRRARRPPPPCRSPACPTRAGRGSGRRSV